MIDIAEHFKSMIDRIGCGRKTHEPQTEKPEVTDAMADLMGWDAFKEITDEA